MKICATCRRSYAEAAQFCLEDGSPLLGLEALASDQATVVQPVPVAPAPELAPPPLPPRSRPVSQPYAPTVARPASAPNQPGTPNQPSTPNQPKAAAQPPAPTPTLPAGMPTPSLPAGMPTPPLPAGMPTPPLPTGLPGQQRAAARTSQAVAPAPQPAPAPAKPRATLPVGQLAPSTPADLPSAPLPAARNHTIIHPNPPVRLDAADPLAEAATLVTSLTTGDEPAEEQSAYIGKLIDDRYLVRSLIGRGGMGAVYRCEQVHLRKEMAIKLLHESLVSRKQLISRFTREARAISRLSSPHTVMVYDFGRMGEIFYLVMELLDGEALDAVLEREGPLPAERAVHLLLQMCHSLAEAHKHGIVHRDLKPENVMLVKHQAHADFVKILDFGLAKVEGADDPYTIHSQRDIFGTPWYMSPEQIRAADVDHRADIYAVGALMFRMLTGEHVFSERTTFDILKAHLMEPPPRMADVAPQANIPPALEQIVAKALQKAPPDRFQTMEELATALTAARQSGFQDAGLGPLPPPRAADADAPTRRPQSGSTAKPEPAPQAPATPTVSTATVTPTSDSDAADADAVLASGSKRQGRKMVGFFGAVAVVLGLATWLLAAPEARTGAESEPNDTPQEAGLLDPKGEARGVIGKRRSPQQADRDCYRMAEIPAGEGIEVEVNGVPNMDLQVSLHTADGDALVTQSHRAKGQGEYLRNLTTTSPVSAVCVTEFLAPGAVAGESLSDQYVLRVKHGPRLGLLEREPNDDKPGDLPQAQPLQALLDGPGDRDLFGLPTGTDQRIVRVGLDLQPPQGPATLRLALLDATGRMLAAQLLRPGELKASLAFVATMRQMPDRLAVQRVLPKGAAGPGAVEVSYKVQAEIGDLADQPEQEPNNTQDTAPPIVLGAWHVGAADDSAGVDWLRIDGGDPAMRRIRINASAPAGNGYWLTVRDQGSQVDVRQLQVTGGLAEQELIVTGTGEGFLLRIQQLPAQGRKKPDGARWAVRARYLLGEEDAVRLAP